MRITDIECQVLVVPNADLASCDTAQDNAVVRLLGDNGMEGVGEVESNPFVIKALIEAPATNAQNRGLRDLAVDREFTSPEHLWNYLYENTLLVGRRGAGVCALGALDMAVWDLYGKTAGKPVWRLLGADCPDPLTPYASLLPVGRTATQYRDSLLAKLEFAKRTGYSAAKLEILVLGPLAPEGMEADDDTLLGMLADARDLAGNMVLMVDVGYAWRDWKQARDVIRKMERHDVFFVETPLHTDDLDGLARLAGSVGVKIAAGEYLQTRFEFCELMDRGKVQIVQPDVGRVGGITEAMRVVKMAEERGLTVVPHCWKSSIGIAATAHVAAAARNCPYMEYMPAEVSESPLRRELAADSFTFSRGRLMLSEESGLGVRIDGAAFARYAVPEHRTAGRFARRK